MWSFFPIQHIKRVASQSIARLRSMQVNGCCGQSLLETALLLPCMIIIVVNAVGLAYTFSVYLNLTTAIRQGAQYSIRGTSTVLASTVPGADSVSSLIYDNINSSVPPAAGAPTRVCSVALGLSGSGSSQVPNCANYGSGTGTFSAPQADPEAPYLLLNRVDVQYTITPLLQGSVFNIVPPITVHRMITMRAMP